MDRRKPPCASGPGSEGVFSPHEPHGFWAHGYASWSECPGWGQRDADTTVLADRLDQVARDFSWPLKLPPGIRLECHPLVAHALTQFFIPSYAEFTASLATGEDVMRPQIPIMTPAGMERGQWRITADDGQVAETETEAEFAADLARAVSAQRERERERAAIPPPKPDRDMNDWRGGGGA